MNRKEFLSILGISAGGIAVASCLSSCKKTETSAVDFTLDLTSSANAALNTNGGFLITKGVIVARTFAGAYIAVAAACTHEGTNVQYQAANNRFHCASHGANFSNSGTVQSGPTNKALQQFTTELSGTNLHVFS
jgi:cytochrome b6-f complex iron-sulfur subunit